MNSVEVSNIDSIKLYLRQELAILSKRLEEAISKNKPEKSPDSVKVNNLSQIVEALNKLSSKIDSLNMSPVINVESPEVNVSSPDVIVPEIKVPQSIVNYQPPDIKLSTPELDLTPLKDMLAPLDELIESIRDMVGSFEKFPSRHDTFLESLAKESNRNLSNMSAVFSGGSSGMTKEEYISALQSVIATISIDQTTQGNTNGVVVNDMALALKGIFNLLKDSLTIDPSTGRLRVAITTAAGATDTLSTVSVVGTINNISTISSGNLSSVTTVTNLQQLNGFSASQTLLFSNEYISWANCVRNKIA